MIAQLVYAIISEQKVKSLNVCSDIETAQIVARAIYGVDAFAIEVTYIPCQEGDLYRDGEFYRVDDSGNEKLISALPTEKEEIENLKKENNELTLALADAIGGVGDVE